MPNLLPDVHQLRAAGRLIWFSLILIVALGWVFLILKPPLAKRTFRGHRVPDLVAYAMVPVIFVVFWLLAAVFTAVQRSIVLAGIAVLIVYSFVLVASRRPRDFDRPATWGECISGALGVFALMALAYGIVPHEWLTFANSSLGWGDTSKFVIASNDKIVGLFSHYPFNVDYPALRDIVVTLIYVVFLGLNLKLFVMWQHRREAYQPKPATAEAVPERQSRFGRPLRAWSSRSARASAPGPEQA
jgi:hypothetical protein